jgi:hypothetical protein
MAAGRMEGYLEIQPQARLNIWRTAFTSKMNQISGLGCPAKKDS